jgi:rod shape-determining protein MreC
MRNLLNFLARYSNLIIFLILEGVSLYYLVTRNTYQNTRVMLALRSVTSGFEMKINDTRSYLQLKEINNRLAAENIYLKNQLQKLAVKSETGFADISDSITGQKYIHTSAEVIDNSVNRQKNFFTINKGRKHGISEDMSVITTDGVAGVIIGCSSNYSVAMSVLNLDFKLSARLKSNGYFGSLNWDGKNYHYAVLSEIPQHVKINVGDTVETTGYSAVFPEGVMIGTVYDIVKPGGDFYKISVSLSTDFKKIHFVDVVGNIMKTEQLELQNSFR